MPRRPRSLAAATVAGLACCLWLGVPAQEAAEPPADEAATICAPEDGGPPARGPAGTCEATPQAGGSCASAPAEPPAGTGALWAFRDPVTGRLVPGDAGLKGLSAAERRMLSRSTEGLVPRVLPNGAVLLDLQGRFMSISVARRNPDGSLSARCVHGGDGPPGHAHPHPAVSDGTVTEASDE